MTSYRTIFVAGFIFAFSFQTSAFADTQKFCVSSTLESTYGQECWPRLKHFFSEEHASEVSTDNLIQSWNWFLDHNDLLSLYSYAQHIAFNNRTAKSPDYLESVIFLSQKNIPENTINRDTLALMHQITMTHLGLSPEQDIKELLKSVSAKCAPEQQSRAFCSILNISLRDLQHSDITLAMRQEANYLAGHFLLETRSFSSAAITILAAPHVRENGLSPKEIYIAHNAVENVCMNAQKPQCHTLQSLLSRALRR